MVIGVGVSAFAVGLDADVVELKGCMTVGLGEGVGEDCLAVAGSERDSCEWRLNWKGRG